MATKRDYYDTGGNTNRFMATDRWLSQSFTTSEKYIIKSVKLPLVLTMPDSGSGTVHIRAADADGLPTGPDLCSGGYSGDDVSSVALEWLEISLGAGALLEANTQYCICLEYTAWAAHWVAWNFNNIGEYAGGDRGESSDGGSTWARWPGQSLNDMVFREYDGATLYEHNDPTTGFRVDSAGDRWIGQSFTPQTTHNITKVSIHCYRNSGYTDPVYCRIWELDAKGHPASQIGVGSVIHNSLPRQAYGWKAFPMDSPVSVQADVKYAYTINGVHNVKHDMDDTGGYPRGSYLRSEDGGTTWTSYAQDQDFLFETWGDPAVSLPTVTTDPASSVEATTAALNGKLDSDGGEACNCGFEWGETIGYGNTTPIQSRTTGQTFAQTISGLDPKKTYHFRALATNSVGTGHGDDRTFTTSAVAPTVATNPAIDINNNSATLKGKLTYDGGEACNCAFEYGETETYGTTTTPQSKVTGEAFSQPITGLDPNKTYHFRAIATNSAETSHGADRTFKTLVSAPAVTTKPATGLGAVLATLNGTLTNDIGEACECGFDWGLDTEYGITTPTESKITDEDFSQVIGGLIPNTVYHFRAFATNSFGTGYGDDETFTTALVISKAFALAREEL